MAGNRISESEQLIIRAAAASGSSLADVAKRLGRTDRALRAWSSRHNVSWDAAPRNRKRPGRKPLPASAKRPKAPAPARKTRPPRTPGLSAPSTELEAQQLLADIGAGRVSADAVQVAALRAFIESRRTTAEAQLRTVARRDAANLVVDIVGELDAALVPRLRVALQEHLSVEEV